jgi:hypothetical protein
VGIKRERRRKNLKELKVSIKERERERRGDLEDEGKRENIGV